MAQAIENNVLENHDMAEQLDLCKSLIHELHSKQHAKYAWPFLTPVDPVKLGIPDYFEVIKKPMDFGTVKKKLENNEYKSITEFADDARLVFTNCYKYNGTETAIVPMAKKLEGAFESHFAQILSGETTAMGDSGGNDECEESSESSSSDDDVDDDIEEQDSKKRKLFHQYTSAPPSLATDAVLVRSEAMPEGSETVRGYDFNNGLDYHQLLMSYKRTGFQALNFGKAVEEINKMIDCKLQPVPEDKVRSIEMSRRGRPQTNCTIFLAYTSNLISSGVREILRYLVQHNMVDCIVTTAGGIEEDFIKCMASTYLGDFTLKGKELREKGINRIGNLLVPNDNYCKFEDWLMPILNEMVKEQREQNILWTPSKMIDRLGREINHPDSVYYWAHKNNIPVFCPAITDGSLGDIIYFHSYKNPGLVLDLVQDIRGINSIAVQAVNSGMIIVGGGVVKHHTANANLMRNGADYCVYLNTASEFDGSDSGARPDEAVSWGKIKKDATPVKIYGEATLVLPLLIAETFARREKDFKVSPDNG